MTSAKFSDVQKKHQRLLDTDMFNQLAADLVEFIWGLYTAEEGVDSDLGIDHATELRISPPFFGLLMTKDGFKDILSNLDISYEDQLDLFETLDVDGNGVLDMEELVVGISKLRGDARRTDVVGISLVVRAIQADLTEIRKHLEEQEQKQQQQLQQVRTIDRPVSLAVSSVASRRTAIQV
eukprot:CAMPEP_0179248804 /NCGR_PEP_ID=MMETSP0797-20121207/20319_1 /TAXON_ID=47934 /ORGANISM="Dinophysis acuminata, Strain DAEP01" /LENGTH=179 /DNA_ID=CAMNT_0020956477 /DNA_START=76 /DNA_END=615 /DNA_ORIENTATION=-